MRALNTNWLWARHEPIVCNAVGAIEAGRWRCYLGNTQASRSPALFPREQLRMREAGILFGPTMTAWQRAGAIPSGCEKSPNYGGRPVGVPGKANLPDDWCSQCPLLALSGHRRRL